MESFNKNIKQFIISKNIDETTSLDLKDFFEDPKRYLENKKFIVGDKRLINIRKPLELMNKKKNFSQNELIRRNELENNKINETVNNEHGFKTTLYSLSKLRNIYYKQKLNQKFYSSPNRKEKLSEEKTHKNFQNKKILFRNLNNDDCKYENNLSLKPKSIHYEFKTKKEILDMFKNFIKNNKKQKESKDNILRPLSSQKNSFTPKRKLSFKEIMKTKDKEKKNFDIFSNYLSKKCDRDKKNLLMSRIDDFNFKKYMTNYLQENKLFSERLGNKYWICSLRRNKNKNERKINYVITGKSDKEPWEQIVDSGILEHEYINNPSNPELLIKYNNISGKYKKFIKKFPFLTSFNNLKVEGKNLLKKELNNFSNNISHDEKINYKLYKDPLELKEKCINEIIYKQNYISPSKSRISIKKKNNKFIF